MPIAKRVASAIALHSSADFTCFYMSDAFDSFRQAYAFAVQTDSWRLSGPTPQGEVIIEDNGSAAPATEVIVEDNGSGVVSAAPPSAAEFNLKGCPPLYARPSAFSSSNNCLHPIA
jgi:hypothetical protein